MCVKMLSFLYVPAAVWKMMPPQCPKESPEYAVWTQKLEAEIRERTTKALYYYRSNFDDEGRRKKKQQQEDPNGGAEKRNGGPSVVINKRTKVAAAVPDNDEDGNEDSLQEVSFDLVNGELVRHL